MNRREALAGVGITLAVACSGCVSGDAGTGGEPASTVAGATPSPGNCEVSPGARPTPDSSRARAYPSLPEDGSPADRRSFATAFERAFQYNSRIPDYRSIQVDLTAPSWATSSVQDGHTVGVDARVQFGNPTTPTPPAEPPATPTATSTPRPSGRFEYAVYYLVTDRFALRTGPSGGNLSRDDSPTFRGADTVVCEA